MVGKIPSFQSLGTVDGPGVRYVVFMQGCHLRCIYCHNPETWSLDGGKEYTPNQVFEQIKKYKSYIKNGGVTVTGGEPLLQIDFVTELFKLLKEEGIHTALDTAGFSNGADLSELFKYTDLVICDVKFINDEDYRKYTGKGISEVLDFLDKTLKHNIPLHIREVIVPNINDNAEYIEGLKDLLKKYTNIEKVELLPFRKLCLEKYEEMGLNFRLKDTDEMSKSITTELEEILRNNN